MTPLWSDDIEQRVRTAGKNLDKQERPDHVQFCTRCVVSNQRPRIVFDDEGVCSACRFAERKQGGIDWQDREQRLQDLLDRHRRGRPYDVIVPCSGGKDSGMVAHRLKHDYGMHPLCVCWEPFVYTDIGRQNLEALKHAGFDVLSFGPNGLLHRKLARLAFEFYGDPFQPFAYGQLAWPMIAAFDLGVDLVMFGENGEAEYGGDPAANDKPCWSLKDWERVYLKYAGVRQLIDVGRDLGVFDEAEAFSPAYEYRPYFRENREPPQFHWFGYYHKWHPQGNFYYASEHTGFTANPERTEGTYNKYASIDDKMDGLHYYTAFLKFGIGRATSDAAHEIRDGEITREEGVALVERFDGEFPNRHLPEMMGYLGFPEDYAYLSDLFDRFRAPHVWKREGDDWHLRHAVWYPEDSGKWTITSEDDCEQYA